jgi:hypothetical protein
MHNPPGSTLPGRLVRLEVGDSLFSRLDVKWMLKTAAADVLIMRDTTLVIGNQGYSMHTIRPT